MATRSVIGVMHGDICKAVYCHWDGYLANNGRILNDHYDSAKANELVSLGSLSSLGKDIGEKHSFDNPFEYGTTDYFKHKEKYQDMCTFYGRDREETGQEYKTFNTYKDLKQYYESSWCEYVYIMKDGIWYVDQWNMNGNGLVDLADALNEVTQ